MILIISIIVFVSSLWAWTIYAFDGNGNYAFFLWLLIAFVLMPYLLYIN